MSAQIDLPARRGFRLGSGWLAAAILVVSLGLGAASYEYFRSNQAPSPAPAVATVQAPVTAPVAPALPSTGSAVDGRHHLRAHVDRPGTVGPDRPKASSGGPTCTGVGWKTC